MARIGFHASHEQFPPAEVLDLVRYAAAAGFDFAMSSDHFRPWGPAQGHSGSQVVVGRCLGHHRTAVRYHLRAGYRYRPAILAQAAATLTKMFPGRLWLALG